MLFIVLPLFQFLLFSIIMGGAENSGSHNAEKKHAIYLNEDHQRISPRPLVEKCDWQKKKQNKIIAKLCGIFVRISLIGVFADHASNKSKNGAPSHYIFKFTHQRLPYSSFKYRADEQPIYWPNFCQECVDWNYNYPIPRIVDIVVKECKVDKGGNAAQLPYSENQTKAFIAHFPILARVALLCHKPERSANSEQGFSIPVPKGAARATRPVWARFFMVGRVDGSLGSAVAFGRYANFGTSGHPFSMGTGQFSKELSYE